MGNIVEIMEAANHWVFVENGDKWLNNNNEAGDNFNSFIEGVKWVLNYKKYVVTGKENDGFIEKGRFNTMEEALELANKLNSEQNIFYYDYYIEDCSNLKFSIEN